MQSASMSFLSNVWNSMNMHGHTSHKSEELYEVHENQPNTNTVKVALLLFCHLPKASSLFAVHCQKEKQPGSPTAEAQWPSCDI